MTFLQNLSEFGRRPVFNLLHGDILSSTKLKVVLAELLKDVFNTV